MRLKTHIIKETMDYYILGDLLNKYNIGAASFYEMFNYLKRYQRETVSSFKRFHNYAGAKGLFVKDVTSYTLYRGLKLSDSTDVYYHYPLDKIKKEKHFVDDGRAYSWTTTIRQAEHFAYGNRTWMEGKKDWNQVDKMFLKYGVILKHTFPISQVLFDLDFISEIHHRLDFEEDEVIVVPKKGAKYKVIKIL